MDRNQFWKIIDDARQNTDDAYDVAEAVCAKLSTMPAEEIVSFKQHQTDLSIEAYRWDLWAIAFIVNGGCSDDSFEDFRAWLMANGSERWNTAMANPESIGEWAEEDEAECEDMLYVAIEAYESKTGEDFPYDDLTCDYPPDPAGEPWDEEDLEDLYPALCEKYW